jgi:protein-disulfide isomerase-like protein with CxxC motif
MNYFLCNAKNAVIFIQWSRAPPDERGGNRQTHPTATAPHSYSTEVDIKAITQERERSFRQRFNSSERCSGIGVVLPKIASELGLDKARFASCLASGKFDQRVAEDVQNATATGGRGTPWTIIVSKSGKTYPLSGAQPYEVVKRLVDLAREKK